MKVILYIRSIGPGRVSMKTRLEPEPNYNDTPRVNNFAHEIDASLREIIGRCEKAGMIQTKTAKLKT